MIETYNVWCKNNEFYKNCNNVDNEKLIPVFLGNSISFYNQIDTLRNHLTDSELIRSEKLLKKTDQECYIASHAFLNLEIQKILKPSGNKLIFNSFKNGKPYLEGFKYDFNLSHTKNYFVFVIGNKPEMHVGIDIEHIESLKDFREIAKNYMSAKEFAYIFNHKVKEKQVLCFYEIWTRKEAFLKMLGLGIIDQLYEINMIPGKNTININFPENFKTKTNTAYIYTIINKNFICSLSITEPRTPVIKAIE